MSSEVYYINNPDNTIPDSLTTSILKNNDAFVFHKKQKAYSPTPLINLPNLAKKFGVGNIYIKDESKRFGLNAFKVLGAHYAVAGILKKDPGIKTICTATDGNHGRAVAWSAKIHKREAVVIVPLDTSSERITAIKSEGASVEKISGNYDEACKYAAVLSGRDGWALVQDTATDDYQEIPAHIMSGYLTLFKEMNSSIHGLPLPGINIVFLQAGVGSFAGAGTWYYHERYKSKRPKIVIVEPTQADALLSSFKMDKLHTSKGSNKTIMAGLNCSTPSSSAWDIIKSGVDISIKIDDDFTRQAIRELYFPSGSDTRMMSGESGAAGLAGFLAIMEDERYKPLIKELDLNEKTGILFINTEGPTDLNSFQRIIL